MDQTVSEVGKLVAKLIHVELDYLKVSIQGLQAYCSVKPDLPGQSIFMWPKIIASSWLKIVCIFDDDDVKC